MRKLIFLFLAIIGFTACQKQEPVVATFDNLLAQTDSLVASKYPTAELYEVQTALQRNADSVLTDTVVLTKTQIAYNLSDSKDRTLVVTFDSLGVPTYTTYASPWMEDVLIQEVNLSLKEALVKLYETDVIKPTTDFMTLRQPLYPGITEPIYIFGTQKYYVSVGANTGTVK